MSQTVPEQTGAQRKTDWRQAFQQWMEQSQKIVLKWLYEVGGWIFTGLIAIALMIVQDLISLGPSDRALLIAAFALAAALPLNLTGLWIVRYIKNLDLAVEEAKQYLAQNKAVDEDTVISLRSDDEAFSAAKKKFTNLVVTIVLALSVLFTLIGISSALWHISWAATIILLISLLAGLLTTLWVLAYR